ncbi:hypothetical protein [Streptomyces sp. NPDC053079]|uniref:hypothetical protein n=1 Tax=Streptomyces sp. NPDC053079 TaxID=3365697 RepID=UPI0037D8471B
MFDGEGQGAVVAVGCLVVGLGRPGLARQGRGDAGRSRTTTAVQEMLEESRPSISLMCVLVAS